MVVASAVATSVSSAAAATATPAVHVIARPRVTALPAYQLKAFGAVWVLSETELVIGHPTDYTELTKIDSRTGHVLARVRLGWDPVSDDGAWPYFAAGGHAIWVVDFGRNQLIKIDPATDRVVRRVATGTSPNGVGFGFGSVWVSHLYTSAVWRYNPRTLHVTARIPAGDLHHHNSDLGPISIGDGAVWVDEVFSGKVQRIDPRTGSVSTISVAPAQSCGKLYFVANGFWLDDAWCSQSIYRYDASTRQTQEIDFPTYCLWPIGSGDGAVWITYATATDPNNGSCVNEQIAKYNPTTGVQEAVRRTPADGPVLALRDHTLWIGQDLFYPPMTVHDFHVDDF
jgi:streptogramin lyase